MSGQISIGEDMARLLRERRRRLPDTIDQGGNVLDIVACPIYAAMPTDQQMLAFAPAQEGFRKIVLATNVRKRLFFVVFFVVCFCCCLFFFFFCFFF